MIQWGMVGYGRIATTFARALEAGRSGKAVAVAGRSPERAAEFAACWNIPQVYDGVDALAAAPEVEAVYVATPHPFHAAAAIAALRCGKAVLCEKPLAITAPEVEAMLREAETRRVLLAEAYMYRFHPQTRKLVELLAEDAIGRVRHLECWFAYQAPYDPQSRLCRPELGGGVIWDIGGYPLSMAMLVAAAAGGRPPAAPELLTGLGCPTVDLVDWHSLALARWPEGITAQLTVSCAVSVGAGLRVYGEKGRLELPNPWVCDRVKPEDGIIRLEREGRGETLRVPADLTSFGYEAAGFAELLRSREASALFPAVSLAESRQLNAALQSWQRQVENSFKK